MSGGPRALGHQGSGLSPKEPKVQVGLFTIQTSF